MGLIGFLGEKYLDNIVIDILREKFYPLVVFIDKTDEKSLPECIADFLDACDKMTEDDLKLNKKVININEKKLDWKRYKRRFLTESPFINPLLDFLRDIGFEEMFDINISIVLKEMAKHKLEK